MCVCFQARTEVLEKQYDTTISDMGVAHQKFMREQAAQMEEFREDLSKQFFALKEMVETRVSDEKKERDMQYAHLEHLVISKQETILSEI